ncbi:MAG: DUF58 domain-containing protein [Planctomycetes bacterium]|nr:DUF58 domain-containing protein [Planctomycetota bacterium]
MKLRQRLSGAGRACLVAAITLGASALLFGHPLPALACGFALGLLLFSSPRGRAFEKLRFLRLPPARLVEDEELELDLEYSFAGAIAPLGFDLRAHGPAAALEGATPALLPTPHGCLAIRLRARKRGRHDRLTFEVQLRGAFGFRPCSAEFEVPTDLWVLPRPRALRERELERMLALRPWGFERPQPAGPGDGEFYALREWREGDSERRVHPRLSARRGLKVLRQFRGEAPPVVHLIVDLRFARDGRSFGRVDFDEGMRFAAGIVRSLLARSVPVSLTLLETGGTRTACAAGCRDLHAFLGELALARAFPVAVAPDVPALPALTQQGRKVVLHLGQIDDARAPSDWLSIRVGAQRYYQLLDMQLAPAPAPTSSAEVRHGA